jgi:hypothetical protein
MAKDNLRMYATILRVAKLHKQYEVAPGWITCDHCWNQDTEQFYEYPCPTIKALNGETQ